jgi:hypothetical protein
LAKKPSLVETFVPILGPFAAKPFEMILPGKIEDL